MNMRRKIWMKRRWQSKLEIRDRVNLSEIKADDVVIAN